MAKRPPPRIIASKAATAIAAATSAKTTQKLKIPYEPPCATVSKRWMDQFGRLQLFVEEHGHAVVSRRLDAGPFAKLGMWVSEQRKAYRLEQLRKAGETVKKGRPRINNTKVALLEGGL